MVNNLQEAAKNFENVDKRYGQYYLSPGESALDYVDFHVTPDELQLIFIKEPLLPVKKMLVDCFTECNLSQDKQSEL